MKLIDSHGRLFGKVSVLDLGAGLIVLLVAAAIFVFPGSGSGSVAQISVPTKPVEVDVIVRGLSVLKPAEFVTKFQQEGKTNIIIRNQPYGQVEVKAVQVLPQTVLATQPDGTVKQLPDPRVGELFNVSMIVTLASKAQITDNGVVFGNSKVKIGTPIELEGFNYNFNSSTIDVRVGQ